jgi:NAD-reducing hydrogenase small subunit
MSFLDLDEGLLDLAQLVEICYSPVIDVKTFPEGVDIALVEGAVANEDHLAQIRLIRARTRILIAFGDCAVTGNVTALRNLFRLEDVLNRAYRETDVVEGMPIGGEVPRLLPRVLRIEDVVPVDYFLPGCPPSAPEILAFLKDLLVGRAPVTVGRKFGA